MLVLRRRAQESIVFEGGLLVTLADVIDHRAWLAFSAPTIPVPVVLAPLGVVGGKARIGLRSPCSIAQEGTTTTVSLAAAPRPAVGDPETVLVLGRELGARVSLAGLELTVAAIEQDRSVLQVEVAELASPVGVSVFSVSGTEVKIGIDAPEVVRVYREEVWMAMRNANQEAAAWSSEDLETLASAPLGPVRSERP